MQIDANIDDVALVEDECIKRFPNNWIGKPPPHRCPRRPVQPGWKNDIGIDGHDWCPSFKRKSYLSPTPNVKSDRPHLTGCLNRSIQQNRSAGGRRRPAS